MGKSSNFQFSVRVFPPFLPFMPSTSYYFASFLSSAHDFFLRLFLFPHFAFSPPSLRFFSSFCSLPFFPLSTSSLLPHLIFSSSSPLLLSSSRHFSSFLFLSFFSSIPLIFWHPFSLPAIRAGYVSSSYGGCLFFLHIFVRHAYVSFILSPEPFPPSLLFSHTVCLYVSSTRIGRTYINKQSICNTPYISHVHLRGIYEYTNIWFCCILYVFQISRVFVFVFPLVSSDVSSSPPLVLPPSLFL